MDTYITADTIRALRGRAKMTQSQLAQEIGVTDKAVSKWETGHGLPDITLLEPLAKTLKVSVAELLTGDCAVNSNKHANVFDTRFYVCPICGNIITALGEGSFHCCGVALPSLEAEEPDAEHAMTVEFVDGERYVEVDHPMTKEHFISFIACVTSDGCDVRKLYPEGAASARFASRGKAVIVAYCNHDGLFRIRA